MTPERCSYAGRPRPAASMRSRDSAQRAGHRRHGGRHALWSALRFGPSTFGIFDAFPDEDARQAHLSGQVAAGLKAKAPELLAQEPTLERIDVLAGKVDMPALATVE